MDDIGRELERSRLEARMIREEPQWALARVQAARNAEREVVRLRDQLAGAVERIAEADRLLRAAYADVHPEDVPIDVLAWLNPDGPISH